MPIIQTPEEPATFEKLLPLYLMALRSEPADSESLKIAEIELQLRRMARAADRWNKSEYTPKITGEEVAG